MPFISDTGLARVQSALTNANTKVERLKEKYKKEETIRDLKMTGEALGSAAIMGYLRGYYEKDQKPFNLPYIDVDAELAVGLALMGGAYLNLFAKYDEDFASAGLGILSHFVGQVARNNAKSAKGSGFSLVAGGGADFIGQEDPNDALARALAG